MDKMQFFGLAVIISGAIVVLADALAGMYHWSFIPPNIFIIGLGLVVIGLVLLWNSTGDVPSS
jgi:protein-S-isoprenylcysteine O-methyltransferase Ste14